MADLILVTVTTSIEFIIQVLNVGGMKYDDTWLILTTVKFSSMSIFLTIWYKLDLRIAQDNIVISQQL